MGKPYRRNILLRMKSRQCSTLVIRATNIKMPVPMRLYQLRLATVR